MARYPLQVRIWFSESIRSIYQTEGNFLMFSNFWLRGVSRPGPRALLAVVLSIPLSISPLGSELEAHAIEPELVAFGQARETAAPTEWVDKVLVEDFNDINLSASSFGSNGYESPIGVIRSGGTVAVSNMDQWGGAPCTVVGCTSRYAVVGNPPGNFTVTLANNVDYRYVGFYWTAGNPGNTVCLLPETGDTCLAEYSTTELLTVTDFERQNNVQPSYRARFINKPHYGNPRGTRVTEPFSARTCGVVDGGDGHCDEPFAFIHIFHDSGFKRVRFTAANGGFEFDNVTVSTAQSSELIDLLPAGTLLGASALPAYSLSAPSVLPVDPRSESVSFPGVLLGGAAASQPNVSLCLTEVNSSGTPVNESASDNFRISATVPSSGVTSESSAPRFVYAGSQSVIRNLTATIKINSSTANRSVANSGSKYLRISVQARISTGTGTCSGSNNVVTAVLVELRPMRLNNINQLGIPID